MTNYDLWAPVYDKMYQFDFDYPKYLTQAKKCGSNAKILSLCCGTGRIMLKLAKEGFTIWGVDLSAGMLQKAKEKIKNLSPDVAKRVHLVQGNLCTVELPEIFDMAYISFLSFHHLTSIDEQLAGLKNIRNHLKENGILMVEMFQPNFYHFSKKAHKSTIHTLVPDTNHEIFTHRILYFNHDQTLVFEDFFDQEFDEYSNFVRGGHRYLSGCYIMRTEMYLLLQMSGFIVEEVQEKKSDNPYEQNSGVLTFICRKSDKYIPVDMPKMSSSINYNKWEPYYRCKWNFKDDIPFYLKQALQFEANNIDILIINDFNHRLAFQLENAGHSVVEYGIKSDLPVDTLNKTNLMLKNSDLYSFINYKRVDFNLGRKFDLICIPNNVLSSWLSWQEQFQILKSCRNHLKKTSKDKKIHSKLIIDNFLPKFEQLSNQNRQTYENCIFKDELREIFSTRFEQYQYRDQIIKYLIQYEEYTSQGIFKKKYFHKGRCRWIHKNEIALLLQMAGLTPKIYSSYKLTPYNYKSGKVLIIASIL